MKAVVDSETLAIFSTGLNFAVAPSAIPFKEIVCGVESALKEVPLSEAEEVRGEVAQMLKVVNPLNLTCQRKRGCGCSQSTG